MLNDFDGNYTAAAAAYCGLEANFTTSDGTVVQLYIVDAYDDEVSFRKKKISFHFRNKKKLIFFFPLFLLVAPNCWIC